MRPRRWAIGVGRMAVVVAAEVVESLAVVIVSLGMILCIHITMGKKKTAHRFDVLGSLVRGKTTENP